MFGARIKGIRNTGVQITATTAAQDGGFNPTPEEVIRKLQEEIRDRNSAHERLQSELVSLKRKSEHRCAITGSLAMAESSAVLKVWEVWEHPTVDAAPLLVCVDSPCSVTLHRRLGIHLPEPGYMGSGPWGNLWTREQIIPWLGNPPFAFREQVLQTLGDLRTEFNGECPLKKAGDRDVCAHCGRPAITRYEKEVPVPFCFTCIDVIDSAAMPEPEKRAAVQAVAAGDRYAWQRIVERSFRFQAWAGGDYSNWFVRNHDEQRAQEQQEARRKFRKEHPAKHTTQILGMADLFGPKVR